MKFTAGGKHTNLESPSIARVTDGLTCQRRPFISWIRREGTNLESRKDLRSDRSLAAFRTRKATGFGSVRSKACGRFWNGPSTGVQPVENWLLRRRNVCCLTSSVYSRIIFSRKIIPGSAAEDVAHNRGCTRNGIRDKSYRFMVPSGFDQVSIK